MMARKLTWLVSLGTLALTIALLPAATVISDDALEDIGDETAAKTAERRKKNDHVVAHWRFQEGVSGDVAGTRARGFGAGGPASGGFSSEDLLSGRFARSFLAIIKDSSGNDRHGHAFGGPLYRTVQLEGSNLALVFDGHDDRVAIPDAPIFYLTKSLTLEAYIQVEKYPETAANLSHIVFRGDSRAGFDPWFLAIMESGQLRFGVADALNNGTVVVSPEPLPIGKLLHVAATLDDATGKQSVFINGKRVATKKTKIRGFGALGGSAPGIGIGNRYLYSNQAFTGLIDEVRISATALSPSQLLPAPRSAEATPRTD